LEQNEEVGVNAKIPGYLIGAKSWTSQIAFRGRYQRGNGRTQGTFVGMVTVDNPQYVVLVWTSRPRTNQWWGRTSGRVFRDVAKFLIGYSLIE
jgi:cell division protein FtsI/penicillin-binding protein 2